MLDWNTEVGVQRHVTSISSNESHTVGKTSPGFTSAQLVNKLQIQHINYFNGKSFLTANKFNIIAIWGQFRRRQNSPLLCCFYCESFVQLLVFDALLSLTSNSGKYQVLFERFLILVVLTVSFPPCPNRKINKQTGYKYERESERV